MQERFTVKYLHFYECVLEIYVNQHHEYTTEKEELTKIKQLMKLISAEEDEEIETKHDCKWLFNLRIYKVIRKMVINDDEIEINWLQAAKSLIGKSNESMEEIFREKQTEEEISEMILVAEFIEKKLTSPRAPVDLAEKFVEEYERPERLRDHLHNQNWTFVIGKSKEAKQQKRDVKVHHWLDKVEQNHLEYYRKHPWEIDFLSEEKKRELLKNQFVREAYHDYRNEKRGEEVVS